MKEDLLMNLEYKKQIKKWRNVSIILICFLFILILGNIANSKRADDDIISGNSIAEIDINGIIAKDDYRDNKIADIIKNDKIKAVILNVDSPGGMVTPSEILYDLIYKLNKTKPVVVLMGSMGTSGAYMISLGADYIIARNTTLTGSIGVLMQSYEFVELAKKIGIELKTFKSSELKGMPSFFEPNNASSDAAIQSSINDIYDYFKNLVRERRPLMTQENFDLSINGQAFTGRQALKIGLIDEIGDKNSALKYLETKKVEIKLPVVKINLKKKINTNILQKLTNKFFFDIGENNAFGIGESGLISIYN